MDGTALDQPALHPVAILAMTAEGTLALEEDLRVPRTETGKLAREWVERFWNEPMRSGKRRYYYQKGWYAESLYLLAMLDCRKRETGSESI